MEDFCGASWPAFINYTGFFEECCRASWLETTEDEIKLLTRLGITRFNRYWTFNLSNNYA
jgi:hypothetical protein